MFMLDLRQIRQTAPEPPHFKHASDARSKITHNFQTCPVTSGPGLARPSGLLRQPAHITKKGPPDGSPFFTKQTIRLLWAA